MSTIISWTNETWNPVTGCSKVSEGCRNCYAERMSYRLKAMGQRKYRNGFTLLSQHESASMKNCSAINCQSLRKR